MRVSAAKVTRRILMALAIAALFVAPVAFAQEHEEAAGHAAEHAGAAGEGTAEHEDHAVIENWWSWDYEGHTKDPARAHVPPPFGFALINFAIFLGIMSRLAWKPLKKFVRDRHDSIAKDLDAAAKLRAEAEATLKQYEAKIAGIGAEIDTLLAQIHKEAEQEKARIIALAEADAKRLREEAERQIANEIDAARRELRRGVIEAAVGAADATLRKNIAADDQRKMAERYVADVEQQAKHTGRPS
jgi:F-type H+-transporting ATPase subunit b